MSVIIQEVWDLCDQFIIDGKGRHVTLKEEGIKKVAEDIKIELESIKDLWWGYPKCFKEDSQDINYKMLCYELIADSVNYQYWYGKHDVRPNKACANEMYELLNLSFSFVEREFYPAKGWDVCQEACKIFIEYLSLARFPNIENRIKHVREVNSLIIDGGMDTIRYLSNKIINNNISVNEFLTIIISKLPGYAEDLFLKRSFLLPIMLYRRVQWFKDEIGIIPIPADYQIPKMLEGLGCIGYDYVLSEKIQDGELIPAGSLEECEIRAATMLAGRRLAELSGHTMCDVDTYLWLKRKEIDKPFHLTITTNY